MKIEKTAPDEGYITVTNEEFLEQLAEGLCCNEVLKPGRNKFIRGGFRKLHPDFDPARVEVRYNVTLALPPEIYQHFKEQAEQTGAQSLEEVMENILIKTAEGAWQAKAAKKPSAKPSAKTSSAKPRRRAA